MLTRNDVTIGVIAAPSHLAPDGVRRAFRAAPTRVMLVTDALATSTPAALFPGRDLGLLRPADRADILVLDDGLIPRTVLDRGVPAEP
ncbi:hypothetical protein [Amycolatopsis cihanbeyliensis]|uniref:hypothetical protein n=1 Tax=Amycolatopsis cihanbeyliensis TaxID=1128664 RepID=UPI001154C3F8|nr:hypothetical protein [Amycolatopsis cihanbeyliensis]